MKIIALIGKARSGKDTFARILSAAHPTIAMGLADRMKRNVLKEYPFPISDIYGNGKTKEVGHIQVKKPGFGSYEVYKESNPPNWLVQELGTEYIWRFDSNYPIPRIEGVISISNQHKYYHYMPAGSTAVCCSPREIMQSRTVGMEKQNIEALTRPLSEDIDLLRNNVERGKEFDTYKYLYDRKLGVYPWKWKASTDPYIVITDVRMPHQIKYLKNRYPDLIAVKIERGFSIQGKSQTHITESAMNDIPDEDVSLIIENNSSLEDYKRNILSRF